MLVDDERNKYKKADRFEKTTMTKDIVKTIKASNGRFLKRSASGNFWVEVRDDVAGEKVSHSFRTQTKRQREDQMLLSLESISVEIRGGDAENVSSHEEKGEIFSGDE